MRKDKPVKGKLKPVDNFSGHAKDALGVGEQARLTAKIKPSKLTAEHIGGLKWEPGTAGTVSSPDQNVGSADVEARDTGAAGQTIKIVGVNGPYANVEFDTLTRAVVAPDRAKMKRVPKKGIHHVQGTTGVGFAGATWIHAPRAVSLSNIMTAEDANTGAVGQAGGCVDFKAGEVHDPGDYWADVNTGNPSAGDGVEELSSDEISTPDFDDTDLNLGNGNGWFQWDIQWFYRVGDAGAAHLYVTVTHREDYTVDTSAKGNHRATIKKGGAGPFTKKKNDPDSDY
jgi:hypothetical protein